MTATTRLQTIVLSWSGVLSQMFHGLVSVDDLDGALFYFGCTRGHAFDPASPEDAYNELDAITHSDPERGKQVYAQLMEAVSSAEADGRVTWRELRQSNSYDQLNELLARNGLPAINPPADEWMSHYSYPAVHEAVREQELPYNVISIASERR